MGELKKARVPESDDVLIMLDYCSKLTVVGYQKKRFDTLVAGTVWLIYII